MVIYEVNLDIHPDIFDDFYHWLVPHVKQILQFTGFQQAEIGLIEQEEHTKKIRVNYRIDSYENLQCYLTQHAATMRADAINRFGEKFSASRRIIRDPILVTV